MHNLKLKSNFLLYNKLSLTFLRKFFANLAIGRNVSDIFMPSKKKNNFSANILKLFFNKTQVRKRYKQNLASNYKFFLKLTSYIYAIKHTQQHTYSYCCIANIKKEDLIFVLCFNFILIWQKAM